MAPGSSTNMDSSAVNPRPYYNPSTFDGGYSLVYRPGLGVITENGDSLGSLAASRSSVQSHSSVSSTVVASSVKSAVSSAGSVFHRPGGPSMNKYSESMADETFVARNVFADLEFQEYLDFSNATDIVNGLGQSFFRVYTRTLASQPFDVSRLLLQVGEFCTGYAEPEVGFGIDEWAVDAESGSGARSTLRAVPDGSDSDEDVASYFREGNSGIGASSTPQAAPQQKQRRASSTARLKNKSHRRRDSSRARRRLSVPLNRLHNSRVIHPLSLHTIDIMSAVFAKEGPRGMWRALNVSVMEKTLTSTLEAWISGFLSPVFRIPDPYFIDPVLSPEPVKTLVFSIAASVLSCLLLAPVDLIRTRLMVTSTAVAPRSFRVLLKALPSLVIPLPLVFPTVLYSLAANAVTKATPYFLQLRLGIDPFSYPITYSLLNLLSNCFALLVRLPFETILRRAQVDYLLNGVPLPKKPKIEELDDDGNPVQRAPKPTVAIRPADMIVQPPRYSGVFGTMYSIIRGSKRRPVDPDALPNENVGYEALFRGLRVGLIGIFGSWGLGVVGSVFEDEQLKEQNF